ncbi:hypothetical protein WR25_21291 [Diploscapter pachys]|uniref:SUEL-type lectin domain-containing protein n=1 Tax=Diploscapter pachys TaxID=2018661 RepID=A0A2A2LH41_9BILA|nr:hypothetical protein WR25_21291 [Diploscapter pachys]
MLVRRLLIIKTVLVFYSNGCITSPDMEDDELTTETTILTTETTSISTISTSIGSTTMATSTTTSSTAISTTPVPCTTTCNLPMTVGFDWVGTGGCSEDYTLRDYAVPIFTLRTVMGECTLSITCPSGSFSYGEEVRAFLCYN